MYSNCDRIFFNLTTSAIKHLSLAVAILLLLLPGRSPAEDPQPDPSVLSALLEQCASNGDPEITRATLVRLTGKPNNLQPLRLNPQPEYSGANLHKIKQHHANILRAAGLFILEHPAAFPAGLPPLAGLSHRERLGPLFSTMEPFLGDRAPLKVTFGPLDPLITADWLAAANCCGAIDFIHTVRAYRGQLGDMLMEYQQAADETGMIRLGEMLGLHPEVDGVVQPERFEARTLALLLAGALGNGHRNLEHLYPVLAMAAVWERTHPGLGEMLASSLWRPCLLPWCRALALFHQGQRVDALRQIVTLPTVYQAELSDAATPANTARILRSYELHLRVNIIGPLLADAASPDGEFPELASCLPVELLGQVTGYLLLSAPPDEDKRWRGVLLLRELLARGNLPGSQSGGLRFNQTDARKMADSFTQAGRIWLLQEVAKSLPP